MEIFIKSDLFWAQIIPKSPNKEKINNFNNNIRNQRP